MDYVVNAYECYICHITDEILLKPRISEKFKEGKILLIVPCSGLSI